MKRSIVAVTLALLAGTALATTQVPTPVSETEKKQIVPSLLVQSSHGYMYRNGKLTLQDVSPSTVIFADRPERVAGHTPTDALVADWGEGPNSFAKNPPNANFSVFEPDGTAKNVVVELRNPRLQGNQLTYDVKMIEGKLPPQGGENSMFIDIIGMPLTPMSYAGVARRWTRRAVFFR